LKDKNIIPKYFFHIFLFIYELINPEFIKHEQSESYFLKGTKQSFQKKMGCRKNFIDEQEEVAPTQSP